VHFAAHAALTCNLAGHWLSSLGSNLEPSVHFYFCFSLVKDICNSLKFTRPMLRPSRSIKASSSSSH